MITLIVGVPGSGKTFYAVERLIPNLLKKKPVCFSNIRKHVDSKSVFGFDDDFTVSEYDNALIVLDEVQFFSLRDARGELFRHLTIHRHSGREYIWITQSVSAIPRKWLGLVERTIEISSIAGSQLSRARYYQGLPRRDNPVLSEVRFLPGATDKYQTVEDNAQEIKRTVPFYVWKMAAALVGVISLTAFLGFYAFGHFMGRGEASISKVSVSSKPAMKRAEPEVLSGSGLSEAESKGDSPAKPATHVYVWPLSLEESQRFLADHSPKRFAVCNKHTFSDNPYYHCSQKSRKLTGHGQSFRLFVDQSIDYD